ncbi:hypothetical protein jhhlp_005013 [Lomentospora prolificans]|uniref:FAD/NAD(P)-binding domain-containing protein n=1 Tax=Lomentospora prolificans TaxID=41688 RepID=A0A2N3N846_9PEZI|nr:hypothetical protein jhhlp_005013 [Lomentospora prolificans]
MASDNITTPDYDIVIIGAGISGINTAYRIQTELPGKSYTIFEARDSLGGTWDLFKYPGIRSDSDLHTFGFAWRPWTSQSSIADGSSILRYLTDSVEETGIDKKIQYGQRVESVDWSSQSALWSVTIKPKGSDEPSRTIACRWIVFGTGYYDYDTPLPAIIPGIENFKGIVVHPQFWPTDLNYADKNIVIIGSGATAITLLPSLAQKASHVTMLQRTPTYILSLPAVDKLGNFIRKLFPSRVASYFVRLKFIVMSLLFFKCSKMFPSLSRRLLLGETKKQLPPSIPIDPHFNPPYNPWDQRLCTCPAGDFYKALSDGKGSVVTAHIDTVTEDGIRLKKNSEVLQPDIIVTATGLKLRLIGGIQITIDNQPFDFSKQFVWRGALLQNLPNATFIIGYTNASWTLGADANATVMTRIIKNMDKKGAKVVIPSTTEKMREKRLLNLNSTYIHHADGMLPKTGDKGPWKPRDDYLVDVWKARFASIESDLTYV